MVPISPARRTAANQLAARAPDVAAAVHFHTCPVCGQAVDRRRLGDVIHHETPGHAPLAAE